MPKNNTFIFLVLLIIIQPSFSLKKNKQKKNEKIQNEKDKISSILLWAKNNNIYIQENLILNKNIDSSSNNFYYFSSNSSISNNTLLMKIPYNIMISKETLSKYLNKNKNKKILNLWERILSLNNENLPDFYSKQLLYMAIILEYVTNNKKGPFYNRYEQYFEMYEYIDMDNFPVFFDEDEIYFLSPSGFGAELIKATESLKEEYLITKNELKIESSMPDSFLKYRVLSLSNSIRFNNTNLPNELNTEKYNDTVIVPFIDCFKKKIYNRNSIMAEYSFIKDESDNYNLEIRALKDIKKGEEITLQWKKLSNQDLYLYYGFIDEENLLLPKMYVNVLNNMMKNDLGIDENKNFSDIAKRDLYELNSEFIEADVVYSYKNISEQIDKYKNKKEGRYEMMEDNLNYYLRIYDEQLTDGNINIYIRGKEKKRIIKLLMKIEKKIFKDRINYVRMLIQDIREKKYNLDDL